MAGLSENYDCHFTWVLEDNDEEGDPENTLERQQVKSDANAEIELMCLPLIAYLHCKTKSPNYNSALEVINDCLDKCHDVDGPNRDQTVGYEVIALWNKIHILRKLDRASEALKIEEEIAKLKLDDKSEAAMLGCHAYALSIFGPKNYDASLQCYVKARKLDPECYLWCFGIAHVSGRIRRIIEGVKGQPTEIEEENFRTACDLTDWKKAIPIVFLADILFARGRERKDSGVREDKKLMKEAKELFEKAYELSPDSTHVLKKCGKGFALMNCEELGIKCLTRVVELDPHCSQGFHRLGQIYEFGKINKNLELAEKYYLQAVTAGRRRNFFAECDLSRARKKRNVKYDLVNHYKIMKMHYENDAKRTAILDEKIQSCLDYQKNKRHQYRK